MAKVKIELNRAGVRELLRSAEIRNDLERRARAIASAAGEGHEVDSAVGPNRARASVRTVTHEAAVAEAKDRNLTRSIDRGRS